MAGPRRRLDDQTFLAKSCKKRPWKTIDMSAGTYAFCGFISLWIPLVLWALCCGGSLHSMTCGGLQVWFARRELRCYSIVVRPTFAHCWLHNPCNEASQHSVGSNIRRTRDCDPRHVCFVLVPFVNLDCYASDQQQLYGLHQLGKCLANGTYVQRNVFLVSFSRV